MLITRILLLLFCLIILVVPSVAAEGIHTGQYTMIRESEWEMLNAFVEDGIFASPQDFLQVCDQHIEEISVYLGREDWIKTLFRERIEFFSTRHLPSYTSGSYMIAINSQRFGENIAPIAREITSLILRRYNSYSLHIGIAAAMQDLFGKNIAPYNLGENPDEFAIEYLEKDYLIEAIGAGGYPYHLDIYPGGSDREPLYLLSHSFVNFLLDEYGIEKVMEVYDAPDLITAYKDVFGREFESIRRDWLDNL